MPVAGKQPLVVTLFHRMIISNIVMRMKTEGPSMPEMAGTQRATMQDVAREAGCSQTTVSFVLGGATGVQISTETRRRVIEAAAELGYRPRARADGPRSSRLPVKTVALQPEHGEADPARARSRTARVANEVGLRIIGGIYAEG